MTATATAGAAATPAYRRRNKPSSVEPAGVGCDVVVVGELGITVRAAVDDGPGGGRRLRSSLSRVIPPPRLSWGEERQVDTPTIVAALAMLSPYRDGDGQSTAIALVRDLARDGVGLRVGVAGTVSSLATPDDPDHVLRVLDQLGADTRLVQVTDRLGQFAVVIADMNGPTVLRHRDCQHPLTGLLATRWYELVDHLSRARAVLLDTPSCAEIVDQYTALATAVRNRNPAVRIVVHSFANPRLFPDLLPLVEHSDLAVLHDHEATDLARWYPDAIAAHLTSRPDRAIVQIDSRTVEITRTTDTPTAPAATNEPQPLAPGTATTRYRWTEPMDPAEDGPGGTRLAILAAVARAAARHSSLDPAIKSVIRRESVETARQNPGFRLGGEPDGTDRWRTNHPSTGDPTASTPTESPR